MKILIVDDDELARITLSNILCGSGADIVQAADGDGAWARLQGGLRPDVCCCDVGMPRSGGPALMQRAARDGVLADLPFVVMSFAPDRRPVEAAIARGAAGYILKPFVAVQTRITVERVVRERHAERAEYCVATLRRLDVPVSRLEQMLLLLRGEARAFARWLTHGHGGAAAQSTLQRLHGSAVTLGLWKAADHLRAAMAPDMAPHERMRATTEAERLVECQIVDLAQHAPAPAPVR